MNNPTLTDFARLQLVKRHMEVWCQYVQERSRLVKLEAELVGLEQVIMDDLHTVWVVQHYHEWEIATVCAGAQVTTPQNP